MDSEVFGPAESESEVSFLPKNFPGPQMELLFLLVHNCSRKSARFIANVLTRV
jgi:hypothetical protein